MPIDYGNLVSGLTADTVIAPQQIFQALPNKAKKFNYLRDVQGDVLSQWHSSDKDRDTVIKMNTGGGKTTVGLLIAKSSLNEKADPAVFLCPDNYLVGQAIREAETLGLRYAEDPRAPEYAAGTAILICTVQTLFNGRSKFGVGREINIDAGTLIFDDAHACLAIAEEQFSLSIGRDNNSFSKLLSLFIDGLQSQSTSGAFDIENNQPGGFMQVPFWSWQDKQAQILACIEPYLDEKQKLFVWPLIRDNLANMKCYFTNQKVEISGRCLPVEIIPSFVKAKRRIYMSATISDDSVLITAFGAQEKGISLPITPRSASDLGERMIFAPQQINLNVKDEDIRSFVAQYAKSHNVVVIVPSGHRAKFWEPVVSPNMTLSAENLEAGVKALRSKIGQLAVLVNKYDGIDLPDDACRLLVIDGVPDTRRLFDRYEQGTLISSERYKRKQMQRIEQGMGRGIRSNEDYCVVVLMGSQLLRMLYAATASKYLSPATLKQFELSRQLASALERQGLPALKEPINDVLNRNKGWVAAAKNALIDATYPPVFLDIASVAQRKAFEEKRLNQHRLGSKTLQRSADLSEDKFVKGWLLEQAAETLHAVDAVESQKILLAANRLNHTVTKPLKGLSYEKVSGILNQAREASVFLCQNYPSNGNDLVVSINGVLDDLSFREENAERFEGALYIIGRHLGFAAQRPEKEGGGKLDVLWALGNLRYAMFACKSEAVNDLISKQYADQVSGNVNWFKNEYDHTCFAAPVIIHQSSIFAKDASPPIDTRVLARQELKRVKAACLSYVTAIRDRLDDVNFIDETLKTLNLRGDKFLNAFTSPMKQKK